MGIIRAGNAGRVSGWGGVLLASAWLLGQGSATAQEATASQAGIVKVLQGDVRAARAAVEAAQVELLTAQATAERTRALARRNVASTAQLEQAERALTTTQAALQQAQSELIRARDAEGAAEWITTHLGRIREMVAKVRAENHSWFVEEE